MAILHRPPDCQQLQWSRKPSFVSLLFSMPVVQSTCGSYHRLRIHFLGGSQYSFLGVWRCMNGVPPCSLLKCKIAGLWIWIPAAVRERSYTAPSESLFGSKLCVFLTVWLLSLHSSTLSLSLLSSKRWWPRRWLTSELIQVWSLWQGPVPGGRPAHMACPPAEGYVQPGLCCPAIPSHVCPSRPVQI